MPVEPIGPDEAASAKQANIPDAVLEIFNTLITEAINNGVAVIRQDDVVSRLIEAGFDRQTIFDKGFLNVEPIYRKKGWYVVYDKPGYNETYPATFSFQRMSS